VTPGSYRARGEGLTNSLRLSSLAIRQGAGHVDRIRPRRLAFADEGQETATLADMMRRWPRAEYVEDTAATAPLAARIFKPEKWRADTPLRVVLIGSDFEVRVWEALLKIRSAARRPIPTSPAASSVRARRGRSGRRSARIRSLRRPCHRVLGRSGALTGLPLGADAEARDPGLGSGRGGGTA